MVVTATKRMCFSTLKRIEMLALSLKEIGEEHSEVPVLSSWEEVTDKT